MASRRFRRWAGACALAALVLCVGCERSQDLRLEIGGACTPPAPINAIKIDVLEILSDTGVLPVARFGAEECVEVDPPAMAQDPGTLFLPFFARGYVVDSLPVSNRSLILVTLYAGLGAPGLCPETREAMCGLSAVIEPDFWSEPNPAIPLQLLCSGNEPPMGFGFTECVSLSRMEF